MDSWVEQILKAEKILLNDECVVCYKKFINIKDKDYNEFFDNIKEKYNLPKVKSYNTCMCYDAKFECSICKVIKFENNTTCMCYEEKFECSICKNFVCCGCIFNMPDYENGKRLDNVAMFCDDYEKEIYTYDEMGVTGIITCPICRTKDYRLLKKYILGEIKSHK